MRLLKLNRTAFGLLTVCLLLAGAVTTHVLTAGPARDSDNAPRVRTLLKERLVAVRQLADGVKELHKRGLAAPQGVQQAELRVLGAELDLCDSDRERIAVHEKIVTLLKDFEEQAVQLNKRGAAPESEVLEARLKRLEAEIALERARANATTTR